VAYLTGFNNGEQKDILGAVQKHSEYFKKKWNEYFGK
jgi:hypothetical protein